MSTPKPFDPLWKEHLAVRPMVKEDEAFIFATWLKGLYYGNPWFKKIDQDAYFKNYHRVVEALVSRPRVQIRIACFHDDPATMVGYAVLEAPVLHWVFVKPQFRRLGVARELVPRGEITTVSHLTRIGEDLKPKEWKFNPFL